MDIAYVIFGYEWSTDEKGAAPEVCKYQVAKVLYGEHDDLTMLLHSQFVLWKNTAKVDVWRKATQLTNLNQLSPNDLSLLLSDFEKRGVAHWYTLTEDEYNEWVEWAAGDGADEVTITEIKSEYC